MISKRLSTTGTNVNIKHSCTCIYREVTPWLNIELTSHINILAQAFHTATLNPIEEQIVLMM